MIRVLIVCLVGWVSTARADDFPSFYSVTDVAADDVLNIRQAPDPASQIIGTFASDAAGIEVLAVADGWASVNSKNGLGYVAAQFLSASPDKPWYRLENTIYCAGTEPFWSFVIDPRNMHSTFSTADSGQPKDLAIQSIWPGEAWAPSAALSVSEGIAVLRGTICSDGMSDRGFAIGIDIFLNGGGRRITGCCSLAAALPEN